MYRRRFLTTKNTSAGLCRAHKWDTFLHHCVLLRCAHSWICVCILGVVKQFVAVSDFTSIPSYYSSTLSPGEILPEFIRSAQFVMLVVYENFVYISMDYLSGRPEDVQLLVTNECVHIMFCSLYRAHSVQNWEIAFRWQMTETQASPAATKDRSSSSSILLQMSTTSQLCFHSHTFTLFMIWYTFV